MSNLDDSPPPSDDEDFPPPDEEFDEEFPPPPDDDEDPDMNDNLDDFMVEDEPPFDNDADEFPPPDEEGAESGFEDFSDNSFLDEDFQNESDGPPPEEEEEEDPPFDDDLPVDDTSINSKIDDPDALPDDSVLTSHQSGSFVEMDSPFNLPVPAPSLPTKDLTVVSDHLNDDPVMFNIDSLTMGLSIKDPPKLLKKSVKVADPLVTATVDDVSDLHYDSPVNNSSEKQLNNYALVETDKTNEELSDAPSKEPLVSLSVDAHHTLEAKGFIFGLGKYEGDPFEPMFLKADKSQKKLEIVLETGENMVYDIAHKAYVFEDTVDTNTIVLDYHKSVIIFKFSSSDQLIAFMKNMPEEVFFAPDALNDEDSITEKEEVVTVKDTVPKRPISKPAPPKPVHVGPGPKIEHVKGTSVEDILENDFETTSERQEKIEQMFQVKENIPSVPQPPRHRELIDSYIRKPKYSVRRVTLLCEWINSMHIWSNKLTISTLHKEMCNGLLLANLVKKLNSEVQFVHLNEKPLAKKAALENLEQALGHIWRSKSLNNSRIPSANDIYSGNTAKTAVLLNELYGAYVLKPLYKNAMKMLKWYHYVLKQYQRPLPSYIFDDGDLSGVWPHFQSGTALFCVIYHFFGQSQIGNSSGMQRIDPLRMVGDPTSICDFRDNLTYVFHLLRLIGIDIMWTAEDWISNPDTEFILLQLQYIYDVLRFKQCSLPPAQGDKPGLTSGPNGEALVVGLIFSDAPSSLKFIPKSQKAVRLGHDKDSMPLLPVDRMVKNPRFVSHGVLPLGMLSNHNVKIVEVKADLTSIATLTDRGDWNARTTVQTEKENFSGHHLVSILREHHKQAETLSPSRSTKQQMGTSRRDFSVAGETTLSNHQDEPKDGPFKSHDEISREIQEMVRALEDEMVKAQDKISNYEDSLAIKYGELESKIDETPLDIYESQLLSLEDERIQLEQEKQNLQDYFARKLALIRARKDEIQQQHFAKQQAAFSTLLTTTAGLGSNGKFKESYPKLPGKGSSVSQKDIAASEKGWIKLSARMDTHNFHLRSKQAISSAAFQAKITPKSLRGRSLDLAVSLKSGENNTVYGNASIFEGHQGPMSTNSFPENSVQDSFVKFKLRLKHASDKWLQSKLPKDRQSIADVIASAKTPQVELISIPSKHDIVEQIQMDEIKLDSSHSSNMALRFEELQVMFYEDERRRMVIAEEAFEKSVQLSQHLFTFDGQRSRQLANMPTDGQDENSLLNDLHESLQKFKNIPPSVADVETALQYLAVDRLIVVNEQSLKEFVFTLVAVMDGGESKYAIEWKDVPIYSNEEIGVGILLLEDIFDLDIHIMDALILTIYIKESARAVKNSGGRTLMALRFASNSDCLAYCLHLSCLRSIA